MIRSTDAAGSRLVLHVYAVDCVNYVHYETRLSRQAGRQPLSISVVIFDASDNSDLGRRGRGALGWIRGVRIAYILHLHIDPRLRGSEPRRVASGVHSPLLVDLLEPRSEAESTMQFRIRRSTRSALLLIGVVTLVVAGLLVLSGGIAAPVSHSPASVITIEEPTHRVFFQNQRGQSLWVYDVWVADTPRERYQGLSETDVLSRDHGLLFIYDQEAATRTFVMRGMRYPIDIVFIDGTGTVTAVHSAVPEPGTAESDLTRYAGRAKWVLEVPHRSTHRHSIVPGTLIRITGPAHTFAPSREPASDGDPP